MECPNCSNSILEHAKVCPFCQTRLNNPPIKDIETKREELNTLRKNNTKFNKVLSKKYGAHNRRKTFDNSFNPDSFDISYTINSEEQAKLIRDIVNSVGSSSSRLQNNSSISRTVNTRRKKKRISNKERRFIFFGIVIILICILIFWGCSAIFKAVRGSKSEDAFVYIKNNILAVSIGDISREISANLINLDSYKNSQVNINDNSEDTAEPRSSEGAEVNNSELASDKVIELAQQHNFIYKSENKRYIYFLCNFNVSNNLGELKCFDVKKGKVIDIAENVNDSIKISKDGKRLMFLQNTDFSGNAGTLCYKNINEKGIISISEDIDKDMYVFSENEEKVLFLGNFDHSVEAGELYEYKVTDKDAERIKVDSDVCRIFGTDKSGSIYIYAKDYNASRGCYDIYKKKLDEERVRLIEESTLAPVISDTSNEMYMYGGNVENTHNLYLVNVKNNDKKKIASEISDIVQISGDEKSVLYRKIFNESSSDYYIYTKGNSEPQKVANDIRIIPSNSKFSGISQISLSEDFTSITYISGFDIEKGKGVLYKTRYTGSGVSEGTKIADEAFLCHYSADGKRIIYAKNYSVTRNVVDVYSYENSDSVLLKEEIGYNLFEISETGDNIICISDFNTVGEYGTLELIYDKSESQKLLDDVSAFYILNENSIIMLKNYNKELNTFDIYISEKNSKTKKAAEGVTYIFI